VGEQTEKQSKLCETANLMMLNFLLTFQEEFGCDDKKGIMSTTVIDLFCEIAIKAAKLKQSLTLQGF